MKVMGLCGSLRKASINAALLRAAAQLTPPELTLTVMPGLGELPLFNPDIEVSPPESVLRFHQMVAESDALLIASPEYAHGVTGTIKNALDWLVGFEPFVGKAVAVLNASPRAQHSDMALRETLRTMGAVIIESASITIPLLGAGLDEVGMLTTPSVAEAVRGALATLQEALLARHGIDNLPLGPK